MLTSISLLIARAWVVRISGVYLVAPFNNSIIDYRCILSGSVPGFGQMLLRACLVQVHTDIIKCWNFKGEVNSLRFMLRPLDLLPRHRFSTLTNSSNWCYISSKMFILNPTSQRMYADAYYLMSFEFSLSPPNIDIVEKFVSLATAASAPIAPPVAILGLTYIFLHWLSTTVLENMYVTFLAYLYHLILIDNA